MAASWTVEADDRLRRVLEQQDGMSWQDVASTAFPDGSHGTVECTERGRMLAPRSSSQIKGPWSSDEDRHLMLLVADMAPGKWGDIAKRMATRSGKQCRERWHNHLDPSIDKSPFRPEEDDLIRGLYGQIGAKWAEIARQLVGRPDNAIKNHYNTTLGRNNGSRRDSVSSATSTSRSSGSPSPTTPTRHRSVVQPVEPVSPTSPRFSPYTRSGRDSLASTMLPASRALQFPAPEPAAVQLTRSQSNGSLTSRRRSLRTSLQMTPARSVDYSMHIAMPPPNFPTGFIPSGPTTAPPVYPYTRSAGTSLFDTWSTPPTTPDLASVAQSEPWFGAKAMSKPIPGTPSTILQAALDDLILSPPSAAGVQSGGFSIAHDYVHLDPTGALPPSPPSPHTLRNPAFDGPSRHLRSSTSSSLAFFDQGLPGGRDGSQSAAPSWPALAAPFGMDERKPLSAPVTRHALPPITPPHSASSSCSTSSSALSAPYSFNFLPELSPVTIDGHPAASSPIESDAQGTNSHVYTAHTLRSHAARDTPSPAKTELTA